ncbi:UPAR/Ly6 domain-containing protein CG9338-like [Onthophagus taurus]|uniref:UPAR/Ly6 domain-containing protein CG9338-like n=1 Tax=Onthophagus taurus TaxID=166361 RepID=UPI000C208D55|nr:uncharacterized protein LOC111424656 [Onthophagus taurus]
MNFVVNFIVVGVAFMAFIEKGNCLKCYQCNSHVNSTCGEEKVPESFAMECPKNGKTYILCRKIKQVIDFEVNGLPPDSRIIRSCGWDDKSHSDKCYQRSGFGGRQEVCSCKDENCNGAPKMNVFAPILIIIGVFFSVI